MDLKIIFAHVSSLSVLIPLLMGSVQYKRLPSELKLLTWLLVASLLADASSLLLMTRGINSWPVVNLFFIVQFTLLFRVFQQQGSNKYLKGAFVVFLVFAGINFVFLEQPLKFNSFTSYTGALLMLLAAILYLHQVLKRLPVEITPYIPMLCLTFGVLVYFSGNLFLFLFNNYLVKHQPGNHQYIWILHNVLNLIKNAFFAVALWKNYKT